MLVNQKLLLPAPPRSVVCSFLPDCSNGVGIDEMQKPEKTEMQKQKKRENDRSYRQKKKKAVEETKIKLAMTMIENENLKSTVQKLQQEIIQLTKQLNSIEPRPETTHDELQQEIKYLRVENEVTKCLLKDTDASYIPNMIKVLKENEDMKRTIEHYERLSSQGAWKA